MLDQASKLRDLANGTYSGAVYTGGPRIIAVSSGKGGVGKTNFVVNLGLSLAELNQRVVIFDADLGLSNVDVLLGVNATGNLYELLYGSKSIQDIITSGPRGVKFVSGGAGFHELANLEQKQRQKLINSLKYFQERSDYILIDTSAGLTKNVLGFITAAEEVIIIITPEPTSLTDAYSLIKVMSKFNIHSEVNVLINMAADRREAQQTAEKIIKVANRYLRIKVNHLGSICMDPLVGRAVKNQKPFVLSYPNSSATKSVLGIAARFVGCYREPPKGMAAFIGKLFKLFR